MADGLDLRYDSWWALQNEMTSLTPTLLFWHFGIADMPLENTTVKKYWLQWWHCSQLSFANRFLHLKQTSGERVSRLQTLLRPPIIMKNRYYDKALFNLLQSARWRRFYETKWMSCSRWCKLSALHECSVKLDRHLSQCGSRKLKIVTVSGFRAKQHISIHQLTQWNECSALT